MTKGFKTGGRTKGTPNKRTVQLQDAIGLALKDAGLNADFDPLAHLATIAADPAQDDALRFQACKELAPYLHAKRKSVELSSEQVNLAEEMDRRIAEGNARVEAFRREEEQAST